MASPDKHPLLLLSDLHLGCDLKQSSPFGAAGRGKLDRALVGFLDAHAGRRAQGKPWRLLFAGDVFDFVAVTAVPPPRLTAPFPIADEEQRLGLAAEGEKTVWKLRRIAARHEEVFHALARFLVAGNEVHFLRGNHDAELHFPAVQAELVRLLVRRAGLEGEAQRALEARIVFHPWFYFEPGALFVEHGNAHDRYCLQSGFFDEPGAELELPISSKVLRQFAGRWAQEQGDLDHADQMSVLDYVAWVFKMGNPLVVAADYFAMVGRVLWPIAAQLFRPGAQSLRSESIAQARIHRVASWLSRFGAPRGEEAVRVAGQLFAAAAPPAEQSLFSAAQLFYVDRIVLLFAALGGAIASLAIARGLLRPLLALGCAAAFVIAGQLLARLRRCDARTLLVEGAARIAAILPVRFVAMGHSHHAANEPLAHGARYLNAGAWVPGAPLPFLRRVGEELTIEAWPSAVPAMQPVSSPFERQPLRSQ